MLFAVNAKQIWYLLFICFISDITANEQIWHTRAFSLSKSLRKQGANLFFCIIDTRAKSLNICMLLLMPCYRSKHAPFHWICICSERTNLRESSFHICYTHKCDHLQSVCTDIQFAPFFPNFLRPFLKLSRHRFVQSENGWISRSWLLYGHSFNINCIVPVIVIKVSLVKSYIWSTLEFSSIVQYEISRAFSHFTRFKWKKTNILLDWWKAEFPLVTLCSYFASLSRPVTCEDATLV